eukprot:GSChrysophyteH2.ASY1.ANO1.839.1 assembled CDS
MAERKQDSIDILKIDVKTLGDFAKEIISWLDQQWLPFREIFINFNQLRDCNAKWNDETCKDTKYLHQRILASLKVNHYEKVYDENSDETKVSFIKKNGDKVVPRYKDIYTIAKSIHDKHHAMSMQLLNEGFVTMTKSWICNVRLMPKVLDMTLFVVTDYAAYDELKAFDDSLHVVLHKYTAEKELMFGQIGYYNFMLFRTGLILNLLKRGVNLWLTESDATWVRDPTKMVTSAKGDIVAMSDSEIGLNGVQGGFLFLRSTDNTKKVWTKLLELHTEGMLAHKTNKDSKTIVGNDGNEQHMLRKLIKKGKYPLNIAWMSQRSFVSGLWYTNETMRAYATDPVVILNNWIRGNEKKIIRAKAWGHWFLSDADEHQCNMTAIFDDHIHLNVPEHHIHDNVP